MLKFGDRFARQNRGGPPPEFPLASSYSSIVHHLSGPNSCAPTQISGRPRTPSGSVDAAHASRRARIHRHFHCAARVCHSRTRTHVRLLGPCFKTGRLTAFRQPSSGAEAAHRRPVAVGAALGSPACSPRSATRRRPGPITPSPEGPGYLYRGHVTHGEPMLTCARPSARTTRVAR